MSITNPGTIGTMHSVPRLMPGQGVIVGVGAIIYPPEYESADPQTLAELGVGKVVTLTSTYDHRIIQGAESGEMLAAVHDAARRRATASTTTSSRASAFPTSPRAGRRTTGRSPGSVEGLEKVIAVQQLVNMYRVRGHLIANLDPLGLKKPHTHPELDPIHWGLTIWDLDREFPTGGLAGESMMKLRDILGVLRDAYARTDRRRVHAHPGARPEELDPGARRGRARRESTTTTRSRSSAGSTRPRRSSASCTRSSSARSASASKARRR